MYNFDSVLAPLIGMVKKPKKLRTYTKYEKQGQNGKIN